MAVIAQTLSPVFMRSCILFSPEIAASQGAEGSALQETMEELAGWIASSEFLTQTNGKEDEFSYKEGSSCQTINIHLGENRIGFVPRTDFGKKLVALRKEAIAAGMQLLSQVEILDEVKRRRGEIGEYETDVS